MLEKIFGQSEIKENRDLSSDVFEDMVVDVEKVWEGQTTACG